MKIYNCYYYNDIRASNTSYFAIPENCSEMTIATLDQRRPCVSTEVGSGFDELSISFHDPYVPMQERRRRGCRVSRDVAKAEEGWCAVRYSAFQHGTEPRLRSELREGNERTFGGAQQCRVDRPRGVSLAEECASALLWRRTRPYPGVGENDVERESCGIARVRPIR